MFYNIKDIVFLKNNVKDINNVNFKTFKLIINRE